MKGYRVLRALIDLLGGGVLLFRPTDDGSDTARRPGSGRGWGVGGGGSLYDGWPIRGGSARKGYLFEALGIRKGRDYTS